jgi:hypothetical protein
LGGIDNEFASGAWISGGRTIDVAIVDGISATAPGDEVVDPVGATLREIAGSTRSVAPERLFITFSHEAVARDDSSGKSLHTSRATLGCSNSIRSATKWLDAKFLMNSDASDGDWVETAR